MTNSKLKKVLFQSAAVLAVAGVGTVATQSTNPTHQFNTVSAASGYDRVYGTTTINQAAYIDQASRNDGVYYYGPYNTSANTLRKNASGKSLNGKRVTLISKTTTSRSTYAKVSDGSKTYWIDARAVVVPDKILSSDSVSYSAYINQASRNDGVYYYGPYRTQANSLHANTTGRQFHGDHVTVINETTTSRAKYVQVKDGSRTFWIDANAISKTNSNSGNSSNSALTTSQILSKYGYSGSNLPNIWPYRWSVNQTRTLTWKVGSDATIKSGNSSFKVSQAVASAVQSWNEKLAQVGSPIRFAASASTGSTDVTFKAANNSTVVGSGKLGDSRATARTLNSLANRYTITSSTVYLNAELLAQGGYNYNQFVHVTTHEMGHVLGLDHVSDKGQLMFTQPRNQQLSNREAVAVLIAYTSENKPGRNMKSIFGFSNAGGGSASSMSTGV